MKYITKCQKCAYPAVYTVYPVLQRKRVVTVCGRHALKYFRECMGVLAKRRITGDEKIPMPYSFEVVAGETLTPEHRHRLDLIQPGSENRRR